MTHKTTDEENYAGIIEEGFEAYTIEFDEIVPFVKENRGKKLDLTIRVEDAEKTKVGFADLLCELSEMKLAENSIIIRIPFGVTEFSSKDFGKDFSLSELEGNHTIKMYFLSKLYLPPSFIQSVHYKKDGIPLVVPDSVNYVVEKNIITGEITWNGKNIGYASYEAAESYKLMQDILCKIENATYIPAKNNSIDSDEIIYTGHSSEKALAYCASLEKHKKSQPIVNYNKNRVETAVFVPAILLRNSPFYIRIFLYHKYEYTQVIIDQFYFDFRLRKKDYKPLYLQIPKNSNLKFVLSWSDDGNILKKQESKIILWESYRINYDFSVCIPAEYTKNSINGTVELYINDISATTMNFTSYILPAGNEIIKKIKELLSAFSRIEYRKVNPNFVFNISLNINKN